MLLLATQAEPQMVEHAHPNLGRLVQPRHYNALPATIARGVPWAADNDCYQGLDAHAYYTMLDRLHHIGGRCLFVAVPDVVADAYATARQFERWWTGPTRRGLPAALVAQDGLEHMGQWMSMVWPRINALFIGGSTEWKLGPAARAFVREAKRRGLWVHMGRVNSAKRIAYAAEIGCDSIDGTGWMRWRNIQLPKGLQAVSAPPRVALPGLDHDSTFDAPPAGEPPVLHVSRLGMEAPSAGDARTRATVRHRSVRARPGDARMAKPGRDPRPA